jgi:TPR repeat protein
MSIKELQKKAKSKDKEAMYTLGNYYLTGEKGVAKNFDEAYKLLEESAKLKNINSLFQLARIHLNDEHNVKNVKKSLAYFEQSSRMGHMGSSYELGLIYYHGKIEKKNMEKAEDFLRKASLGKKDSLTDAQHLMGYIYENGLLGDHVDLGEAFRFYQMAAISGHMQSQYKVGNYFINGILDVLDVDLEQGIKYLQMASEKSDIKACNSLAKIYIEEAKKLLTKSSLEDKDAEYVLNPLNKIKTDIL